MFNLFHRKPAPTTLHISAKQSVLQAYFGTGHPLIDTQTSVIQDLPYEIAMTGPAHKSLGAPLVAETALLYTLTLPFNTRTHIVGLSKDSLLDRPPFETFLATIDMHPAPQAGIFDEFFDIYLAAGQDFQVHYVLEQEDMQFVVDYSRSHFWEIHDDKLYFALTDHDKVEDNFIQAGVRFMEAIRPALLAADPGGQMLYHYTPYGEYVGTRPSCPDCHKQLKPVKFERIFLVCENGHGVLFTKNDLDYLTGHFMEFGLKPESLLRPHDQMICPNCKHMMNEEMILTGALRILSCEHCLYRWLDATEVAKFTPTQQ